ncbi:hypothetical protein QTP70_009852 [Hemibagrus guttatus]|uniref:Reverse transcriptase domain-containing protein n=1 Tax=Hemibagrus guttatus TaxID=175788 RepID=A0AAE0UM54_9TELE|nr:hypothetical protein QTP70_009852 [Hemibagrus guttatus]
MPPSQMLNNFYTRFEAQNDVTARKTIPPPEDQVLCLTTADVRKTLCTVNPRKAAGPDHIPGRVLRECAEQLADVFIDIFNISLSSAIVLDFLTGTPQSVRIGNSTSSATTLNTGAPQGCVLSPLLFTLLTHNCAAMHRSNHIIKFADDMTVVGLISKNNESAYREEVQRLTAWCKDNNLSLNV